MVTSEVLSNCMLADLVVIDLLWQYITRKISCADELSLPKFIKLVLHSIFHRLYQEVWQSGKLYEYDTNNFDDVKTLAGPLTDGWGITTDNKSLILSDGSSTLSYIDPTTLAVQKTVEVCTVGSHGHGN